MDYFNTVTYHTSTPEETMHIASTLAQSLQEGDIVAFTGPMGVGKTAFIRGIARHFGVEEAVSSPTFSIMHAYGSAPKLHHYDMYRITGWEDLHSTGFFDDLDATDKILLIEWSENIAAELPKEVIWVQISYSQGENQREIQIKWPQGRGDVS